MGPGIMDLRSHLIRVAASFSVGSSSRSAVLHILAQDEEDDTKKKKGPPPRWNEFLKERYEGGKKRVRNTNPKTKDRYPEVSTGTLLKSDKVFQQKVHKEYQDWLSKSKDTESKAKPSKAKGKAPGASPVAKEVPAKGSKAPPFKAGKKLLDEKRVADLQQRYGKEFDKLVKDGDKLVQKYRKTLIKSVKDAQQILEDRGGGASPKRSLARSKRYLDKFESLSPEEQFVRVSGNKVGELFERIHKNDGIGVIQLRHLDSWEGSSASSEANQMHGYMNSLGVSGGPIQREEKYVKESREQGTRNEEMAEWVKESYAFTQAFFRHIGLKEMTLYRGVQYQGLDRTPPKKGDEIELATRELSSFTSDSYIAGRFGRIVEYKVPVDRILSSSLTYPDFGGPLIPSSFDGESEFILMGTTDLTGHAWRR